MKGCADVVAVFLVALFLSMLRLVSIHYRATGPNTLTIYNWGDYVDPDLITAFEEETGLKVIYQTFESNEAMLTKSPMGDEFRCCRSI